MKKHTQSGEQKINYILDKWIVHIVRKSPVATANETGGFREPAHSQFSTHQVIMKNWWQNFSWNAMWHNRNACATRLQWAKNDWNELYHSTAASFDFLTRYLSLISPTNSFLLSSLFCFCISHLHHHFHTIFFFWSSTNFAADFEEFTIKSAKLNKINYVFFRSSY